MQAELGRVESDALADRERYAQVMDAMAANRQAIRTMQPVSLNMESRGIVYLDPASGTSGLNVA